MLSFTSPYTWLIIGVVITVTLISMILHELMHGLVAYWLGDTTAKLSGRLTLNPLRHIDPIMTIVLPVLLAIFRLPIFGGAKPVPFNPDRVKGGEFGAALVALAGPMTNLLLAFLAYVILALLHISPFEIGVQSDIIRQIAVLFLYYTVVINLGFFAFNILPIPPLDGSRVLFAVAPAAVQRVMSFIEERCGLWLVLMLVLFCGDILGNMMQQIIDGVMVGFGYIIGL